LPDLGWKNLNSSDFRESPDRIQDSCSLDYNINAQK